MPIVNIILRVNKLEKLGLIRYFYLLIGTKEEVIYSSIFKMKILGIFFAPGKMHLLILYKMGARLKNVTKDSTWRQNIRNLCTLALNSSCIKYQTRENYNL